MAEFKITTLCYIEKDGCYLMLYRNKKKNDENSSKWIGVGGKMEKGESPDDCIRREVREETGLILTDYDFKGVITFISDVWDDEYMMLYEAKGFEGTLSSDCPEGELRWVPKDQVMDLPLWEGDRAFIRMLLEGRDKINLKLTYRGDQLENIEYYGKDRNI